MDKYTGTDSFAPTERRSFITPLGEAGVALRRHVENLSAIADRLVGSEPVNKGDTAGLTAVPQGLFEDVRRQGDDLVELISAASHHLDRIERALP